MFRVFCFYYHVIILSFYNIVMLLYCHVIILSCYDIVMLHALIGFVKGKESIVRKKAERSFRNEEKGGEEKGRGEGEAYKFL